MNFIPLVVFLVGLIGSACSQKAAPCKQTLDIALVLQIPPKEDSSTVFTNFINNVKSKLINKNRCVRLAVVTASEKPAILIRLSCGYANRGRCLTRGLQQLKKIAGPKGGSLPRKSDLLGAMNLVQNYVFLTKYGARRAATKVCVLILTRVPEKNELTPTDAVKDLHDSGIKILAVGIGPARSLNLRSVSLSREGNFRVQTLPRFGTVDVASTFSLFVKGDLPPLPQAGAFGIADNAAKVPPLITTTDLDDQCEYFADIAFLMDSSGSVRNDYDKEKAFVRRIATRFNISEAGSHGGVIIFSSKGYVTLPIKFNQYTRLKDFNAAVNNLYYYGYETRIDLALDLANNELFSLSSGMRPGIKKVLILITDGRQHPFIDTDTGEPLDPATNADRLRSRNIQLFAIGIGQRINSTELNRITGSEDRVYGVSNFDELISDEFVKKVSQKLCSGGILGPATDPPLTKKSCNDSSCCDSGCCCPRRHIYINIFNGNYNRVLQGLTVTGSKGSVPVINGVDGAGDSTKLLKSKSSEEVAVLLKQIFPEKDSLDKVILELLKINKGSPGHQIINRRRRSLIETGVTSKDVETTNVDDLHPLFAASLAGGKTFSRLFAKEIMAMLEHYRNEENVTLIVPSDVAVSNSRQPLNLLKHKLQNHLSMYIVKPVDDLWTYFKPLNGKQVLRSYFDISTHEKKNNFMIENARLIRKPLKVSNVSIFVMDQVLNFPKTHLLDIIENHPNLTIFASWIKLFGMMSMMNSKVPAKFCLDKATCFPLTSDMDQRLHMLNALKQFTVFAPSNEAIRKVPKSVLKALMENKDRMKDSLGAHVLIGTIFSKSVNAKVKSISPSLAKDSVAYMAFTKSGGHQLLYGDLLQTKVAKATTVDIRATDGVLHIVDTFLVA